jgi:hypothetical protein
MFGLLGGLLAGAGEGLVEKARVQREQTQLELERQFTLQRDEASREHARSMQEDSQAFSAGETDRANAREDEFADRAATAIEGLVDPDLSGGGTTAGDPSSIAGGRTVSIGAGDNARFVARFLTDKGYNPVVVSALLGNIAQESGKNFNTGASGDGGTSIGMGQWHKDRADMLKEYAAANDRDWQDIEVQAAYLDWELQNTPWGKRTMAALEGIDDPAQAAVIASRNFWMPGEPMESNRARNAQEYHDLLATMLHPDTPEGARKIIADGLGLDPDHTSADSALADEGWFPDNTTEEEGDEVYRGRTPGGTYEDLPGPDGERMTRRPGDGKKDEDFELEDTVEDAVVSEFLDPADQALVTEEVKRLVEEGEAGSQIEAFQMAREAAVYDMSGHVDKSWLPFTEGEGGGPKTWRSDQAAPEGAEDTRQGALQGFRYRDAPDTVDTDADGEVGGVATDVPEDAASDFAPEVAPMDEGLDPEPATSAPPAAEPAPEPEVNSGPSVEEINQMGARELLSVDVNALSDDALLAYAARIEEVSANGGN